MFKWLLTFASPKGYNLSSGVMWGRWVTVQQQVMELIYGNLYEHLQVSLHLQEKREWRQKNTAFKRRQATNE